MLRPLGKHGGETLLNVPVGRCLLLLLQNAGAVVSQQEFFVEVWEKQGQYVTANTFYQNISILRKALKTAGLDENVIRTVPKQGIRFTGTVEGYAVEEHHDGSLAILSPSVDNDSVEAEAALPRTSTPQQKQLKRAVFNVEKLVILAIITLLLASVGLVISGYTESNTDFFSNYRTVSLGACQVQYSGPIDDEQIIRVINSHHIFCENNNHIFVTVNQQSSRTAFTVCSEFSRKKQNCQSFLYVGSSQS